MPSCLIPQNQIQLYNIYYYLHQKLNHHQGGYMEEQPLILTIKIYDKETKAKIQKLRKKCINLTELFQYLIKAIVL